MEYGEPEVHYHDISLLRFNHWNRSKEEESGLLQENMNNYSLIQIYE